MTVIILKTFTAPESPNPLMEGELVQVPEKTAARWIKRGLAREFTEAN